MLEPATEPPAATKKTTTKAAKKANLAVTSIVLTLRRPFSLTNYYTLYTIQYSRDVSFLKFIDYYRLSPQDKTALT